MATLRKYFRVNTGLVIAAPGWRAVYACEPTDPDGKGSGLIVSPLVGWIEQRELFEGQLSRGELAADVRLARYYVPGVFDGDREISVASEASNFLGVVGPDEDPEIYTKMANEYIAKKT